ncbi:PepSY domain-containing protein [Methanobacterium formicicum]|uniref:Propeptide pepsy amd peptidase m4 n=1 Tax=Methanobacterium formicicum (strain DSM 3637 / PP1) TaxID=1204725 RepID=K2R2M0_METFP|nr:PepSY domain-containing protein [Methanobacterium formicicum]EKF85442.1 propeptide pepsy amd peptidase m4 [Methanobacterium formicicum DSM 3637]
MIKKSTVALMALIVLMVVVSGCTTNTNSTQNNTQNMSNQSNNNSNNANNTTNSTNLISPEKAKSIAQQYVEEPGVTTGTPVLQTVNGKQVYVVPLIQNGKNVGEIEIDAVTGENLGGAGGAP